MMRLPAFDYLTPTTLQEAACLLAELGPAAKTVAGGTDLLPNMKRRQSEPARIVALSGIAELHGIRRSVNGVTVGALTTLAELAASDDVPAVVASAAGKVAGPQIRNSGTVGGNLCLDTRCNWLDLPHGWRQAAGFCLKDGGDVCWVAPRGSKCVAISSSDLAPVMVALGASVRLVSEGGERVMDVEDFYADDGIDYLTKAPDEILAEVILGPWEGLRAVYHKLRRRGAIDFPILGVAATMRLDSEGICAEARLVVGAVSSAPLRLRDAEEYLIGRQPTSEVIAEATRIASRPVRPFDNADLGSRYRKWMVPVYVERALTDLIEPSPPVK